MYQMFDFFGSFWTEQLVKDLLAFLLNIIKLIFLSITQIPNRRLNLFSLADISLAAMRT